MTRPATGNRQLTEIHTAMLMVAICFQLALSYLFNVQSSFFVADDIIAIEYAHTVSFLEYIQMPIDVHRVPLHRAVNYWVHNLLPMNFAAATALQLLCHATTLVVLYRLLQCLKPGTLNLWLVAAYALNVYALLPLHWWSAALHRYPFVLATVASCWCFVRFYQTGSKRQGAFALLSALIATGFYMKAVLIPLYWTAILLCLTNACNWRKQAGQYVLITIGALLSLTYVVWYIRNNTHTTIDAVNAIDAIRLGLQLGLSNFAQAPLQLLFHTGYAPWINLGWIAALTVFAVKVPGTWRPIILCLLLVSANVLMISASARASHLRELMMLEPRYYFDVLFLLTIFVGLIPRNINLPVQLNSVWQQCEFDARHQNIRWLCVAILLALYATCGWRVALNYANLGQSTNHLLTARYDRNLMNVVNIIGVDKLNLVDNPVPAFFLYELIQKKPLVLSTYLAWHGLHPKFDQPDLPLYAIDDNGNPHLVTKPSQSTDSR